MLLVLFLFLFLLVLFFSPSPSATLPYSTTRTTLWSNPICPLTHKQKSCTHRCTPRTLPINLISALVIAIRTYIVPSDLTLFIITSDPMRNNLCAAFTVTYPDIVFLVVHFLEVGAEFHERARSERVVPCFAFLEESLIFEFREDVVGFLDGDSWVCGLGWFSFFVAVNIGLRLSAAFDSRLLGCVGVSYRHGFAHFRVVRLEHNVQ
jgi:hypothetical protein